ncbi:MAG: hypothetical protein LBR54_03375 [Oscillospiraceae bacterium]|jgi:hypothetical protein|nr:hypothetical protein [Oscillospiraceae bacterium]
MTVNKRNLLIAGAYVVILLLLIIKSEWGGYESPTLSYEQISPEFTVQTQSSYAETADIILISMTAAVEAGQQASVTVRGQPETQYNISVYYSAGKSQSKELVPKISDEFGNVSWQWRIGAGTKPGNYHLEVSHETQILKVYFNVIKTEPLA